MTPSRHVLTFIGLCWLSACSANSPEAPAKASEPAAQAIPREKQLGPQYKAGTSYAAFRKLLSADGWEPAANIDECLKASVGDGYKESCAKDDPGGMCGICKDFREVDVCASDGYCYMTFTRNGATLHITTYGDVRRIREDDSEPVVVEWKLPDR